MRISDWSSDVCSSDLRLSYILVYGFSRNMQGYCHKDDGSDITFLHSCVASASRQVAATLPRAQLYGWTLGPAMEAVNVGRHPELPVAELPAGLRGPRFTAQRVDARRAVAAGVSKD